MIPSVIGWKTTQLLNKVGSNEDLYWLSLFDMKWTHLVFMTSWSYQVSHDITEVCRDSMSLPPASPHRCQSLETNTNNRKLDCSDQFPQLFVRARNQGTDNTLATTTQAGARTSAQWPITHPTSAGEKKRNQLWTRFWLPRQDTGFIKLCWLSALWRALEGPGKCQQMFAQKSGIFWAELHRPGGSGLCDTKKQSRTVSLGQSEAWFHANGQ